MREIAWDDVLSVGVDEIDEDHRKLISIFNILNRAVSDGESGAYLTAVLDELINCTVWHFSHEERLMLKYGYADMAAHQAEHRALIDSARSLRKEILEAQGAVTEEQIDYLERWLTEHIFTTDMRLGDFLFQAM